MSTAQARLTAPAAELARFILALPLAALITATLFVIMQGMITDEFSRPDVIEPPEFAITREMRETEKPPEAKPKPPEVLDPPDVPRIPPPPADPQYGEYSTEWITPVIDFEIQKAPDDSPPIPMSQVPPDYPMACASRGIEGWALVRFDITATGGVMNAEVVDAEPKGCFERSALRAIRQWKYRPMIVDEKPVPQYGKEQRITYELED